MSPNSETEETRERLMRVAGEVFAERGFQAATIKDITERAGVNIASVNYHFGDKLELYREVLRHSSPRVSFGAGAASAPPEERLRAYISDFVKTMLVGEGRSAWCGRMMAHELADPSPALAQIVEEMIRPNHKWLREIIAALTGWPAQSETARFCAQSVTAQCVHWFHGQPVLAQLWPEFELKDPEKIEQIADHIFAFSLGGIRAIQTAHNAKSAKP